MEIIHVFSTLNNNIQTTSDGWKDIPFCLLSVVSFFLQPLPQNSQLSWPTEKFSVKLTSSSIYNYILVNTVFQGKLTNRFPSFPPQVFLCGLCLLAVILPMASSCPPPCLCYSDGLVDCRGRGLLSLPPLHLLPPGSLSLLLANNNLASLGASAFANLSSLEVRLLTQLKLMFHPEFPEFVRYNKNLIFLWCILPIISYDSIVNAFNVNIRLNMFLCAFRNWTSPIITWTIYQLGYSETCPTWRNWACTTTRWQEWRENSSRCRCHAPALLQCFK